MCGTLSHSAPSHQEANSHVPDVTGALEKYFAENDAGRVVDMDLGHAARLSDGQQTVEVGAEFIIALDDFCAKPGQDKAACVRICSRLLQAVVKWEKRSWAANLDSLLGGAKNSTYSSFGVTQSLLNWMGKYWIVSSVMVVAMTATGALGTTRSLLIGEPPPSPAFQMDACMHAWTDG